MHSPTISSAPKPMDVHEEFTLPPVPLTRHPHSSVPQAPITQHPPESSAMDRIPLPVKRKDDKPAGRLEVQKRAIRTMTLAEARAFWRSEEDKIERKRNQQEAPEVAEIPADAQLALEAPTSDSEARRVHDAIQSLQAHSFASVWDFLDAFLSSTDPELSAEASLFVRNHGRGIMGHVYRCDPHSTTDFAGEILGRILQREGEALSSMLRRRELSSVPGVLEAFSAEDLVRELQSLCPTLWSFLQEIVSSKPVPEETPPDGVGKASIRDPKMIPAIACCMLAFTRYNLAHLLGLSTSQSPT